MADERRVSISFGAFAVEIEGYEDPFPIIKTLIEHIRNRSGLPLGEQGFGEDDLNHAELLANLSHAAAKLDLVETGGTPALRVTADTGQTQDAAPATDHSETVPKDAAPMATPSPDEPSLVEDHAALSDGPHAGGEDSATAKGEQAESTALPETPAEPSLEAAPKVTAGAGERTLADVLRQNARTEVTDALPEEPALSSAGPDAGGLEDGAAIADPLPNEEPEPAALSETVATATPTPETENAPVVGEDTAEANSEGSADAAAANGVEAAAEAARTDADGDAAITAVGDTPAETAADPEPATDEETAILRRVRYAINKASEADGMRPPTPPKAKPLSAPTRTPAEQKAEVVKDIASTLRRIGAKAGDAEDPEVTTEPVSPTAQPSPPRTIRSGQLKPAGRKPLTMQMQIRPKSGADGSRKEAKPARKDAEVGAAAIPPDTPPVTPPAKALDRDKIRERLAKLAQDDEVVDNFLFDDVEPTVTVEAPSRKTETDRLAVEAGGTGTAEPAEEPLLLTPAEAAPLILENPIQKTLVLSNPIAAPAPEAPEGDGAAAEEPATAGDDADTTAPEATSAAEAVKKTDTKEVPAESEAGFIRLHEALEADIPVLVEPGTRPKRRNGGPRLVALSDETQFDKSMSPQDFAAHIGATSLHDLLEATAVYMAIVEGRANFSRADVMRAFSRIDAAAGYTTEQRLKTFRKLLATGALTRVDERDYALSHETRFGYETQLRA